MEIRMADHYGMCFGVEDAVELALRLTRQGPLTILGDLVHNPDVVADLDQAGAVRTRQPEAVQTRAVLLTAHGTADSVKRRLRDEGRQLHDAVCPLVKRAHQAADRLSAEGRHLVVIGKADHVEVRGLVGDLEDYTVLLEESEIDQPGRPVAAGHRRPDDAADRAASWSWSKRSAAASPRPTSASSTRSASPPRTARIHCAGWPWSATWSSWSAARTATTAASWWSWPSAWAGPPTRSPPPPSCGPSGSPTPSASA